jgi:hypothetical protein
MGGLDFSRLRAGSDDGEPVEPRAIFTTLPSKDRAYSYPRDVQSEVWEAWHARRTDSDLVIKMNTGGGKTVVGLVTLQACLAEGIGPVIYITPDIYLSRQVRAEAARLGIATTAEPNDRDYLRGRAILVTNVYRLFNGRSVFGVRGDDREVVDVGTVLIDDAHACLATVEAQFTLQLPAAHAAYGRLIELFAPEFERQSPTTYADLAAGDTSAVMGVPFWAWADKQREVVEILHPHREETDFGFAWPLLAESLPLCRAAVSAAAIEIAPPCIPIDVVPSFTRARRRIYLTATLADDGILVTHFGAEAQSIRKPITPKKADDLGDRLILMPQDAFPGTTDETVRDYVARRAQDVNVVVIVPSARRARFWGGVAQATHAADSLEAGLAELRGGHVGLVVLVNKYDGIDLPGDACVILVLDGLPEARGELDRLDARWLDQSDALLGRQVQRIEQGMGRGIRSNDDHCVVLLLGRRLTGRLHKPAAREKLSPATKAQLALSDEVSDQLAGTAFQDVDSVVDLCLRRDREWVGASRRAVVGVTYPEEVAVSPVAVAERAAFDLARLGRFSDARDRLRGVFPTVDDQSLKGVLKYQAAAYLHFADAVGAQELQLSALTDNPVLPKPVAGVAYVPKRAPGEQALAAAEYLVERYATGRELLVGVAALVADLEPSPDQDRVPAFEQAVSDLGRHLGFTADRPERDTGNGPDDLWIGPAASFVIECKSRATADAVPRSDVEQLGHSMNWFAEKYPGGRVPDATPVLIHPVRRLRSDAVAPPGARIITFDRLAGLREAVSRFATSIAEARRYADPTAVGRRLANEHLTDRGFAEQWGRAPRPD